MKISKRDLYVLHYICIYDIDVLDNHIDIATDI